MRPPPPRYNWGSLATHNKTGRERMPRCSTDARKGPAPPATRAQTTARARTGMWRCHAVRSVVAAHPPPAPTLTHLSSVSTAQPRTKTAGQIKTGQDLVQRCSRSPLHHQTGTRAASGATRSQRRHGEVETRGALGGPTRPTLNLPGPRNGTCDHPHHDTTGDNQPRTTKLAGNGCGAAVLMRGRDQLHWQPGHRPQHTRTAT